MGLDAKQDIGHFWTFRDELKTIHGVAMKGEQILIVAEMKLKQ